MKKRISSFVMSLLLTVVLALPAFAAGEDFVFTVTPSADNVNVGDTVDVSLTISKGTGESFDIYGMQNYISFDKEKFELVEGSVEAGSGFNAAAQDGKVYVNRYSLNPNSVEDGEITVLTFKLKAIADGECELTSSVPRMTGKNLESYTVKKENASVEIGETGSDEPDNPNPPVDPDPPTEPDDPDRPTSSIRYDIDVDVITKGGDAEVSRVMAKYGTEIIVTVYPDEGYETDKVIVRDSDGDRVNVREKGDIYYIFNMPRSDVEISVSFKKIANEDDDNDDEITEPVHICHAEAFTDVNTSLWYHEAIDFAVENELMNGVSDTLFVPNGTTTRAMLATVLWRMAGSPKSDAEMLFTDVLPGTWYYDAIKWAAASGVVNGIGEGLFAPDMAITREQLATMIYRYEKANGGGFEEGWTYTLGFTDASSVSSWAYEALSWCHKNKIVNGMGDNLLLPLGNATRAQTAQMLMNYLSLE